MAMSNNIFAMPPLQTAATYVPKWIEGLHDSVGVPTSSWGSFVMRDSTFTNVDTAGEVRSTSDSPSPQP
jgi:hypothetical protein